MLSHLFFLSRTSIFGANAANHRTGRPELRLLSAAIGNWQCFDPELQQRSGEFQNHQVEVSDDRPLRDSTPTDNGQIQSYRGTKTTPQRERLFPYRLDFPPHLFRNLQKHIVHLTGMDALFILLIFSVGILLRLLKGQQ